MGLRRIIVLLIAVVAAGATAMYARSWIEGQQNNIAVVAPPPEEVYEVLVADAIFPPAPSSSRSICAGSAGRPTMSPRPTCSRARAPRTRWSARSSGAASLRASRLPTAAWSSPATGGFLAAVLAPGMRAVSLPINATSSNAGLIFPGDRVDLILTQTLAAPDGETIRRVSETVLRDIRIIAIGAETSDGVGEEETHEIAKTATFKVNRGSPGRSR